MPGRNASPEYIAEGGKSRNTMVHLVKLCFAETIIRLTDAVHAIEFEGEVYHGTGHLLQFSDIEETWAPQVDSVKISLSGVDQGMVAAVLSLHYIDQPVTIWRVFLDADGQLVGSCSPIFSGRANAPVILADPDAGTCSVTLEALNQWGDFGRRPGRHTNHEEQQLWFPGDKGFEFVSDLVERHFIWGGGSIPPFLLPKVFR